MTPEALPAVRRVYLGSDDPADVSVVRREVKVAGFPRPPADAATAAFWLLSLHAGANSRPRYRSVREWSEGRPR